MRNRCAAAVCFLLLLAACGGNTPAPEPTPAVPAKPAAPSSPAPSEERAVGTVRVNVSTLNVRGAASVSSEIVGHVRRGERLTVIADSGDWLHVKLSDGTSGWVSSELVIREGAAARPRRGGCPPDSDYSFLNAPKPAFSEGGAHGMVVIEASVDVRGIVTSTRIVSNETHDDALASMAEREIRDAKFSPPVRNCTPRAFIFTYKRAF
jgi:uncharacterized protein YgiM (DUF1202 family)